MPYCVMTLVDMYSRREQIGTPVVRLAQCETQHCLRRDNGAWRRKRIQFSHSINLPPLRIRCVRFPRAQGGSVRLLVRFYHSAY